MPAWCAAICDGERRSNMRKNLFDILKEDKLFKPLCAENKEIYYDCIQLLIEESSLQPFLYEDNARDIITEYLLNSKYSYEDEPEIEDKEIEVETKTASQKEYTKQIVSIPWRFSMLPGW